MDGELLFIPSMLFLWIVLGGAALRFSANTYFKKDITLKRAIGTQAAMIVVLPFWTHVYCAQWGDIFVFPYRRFHPLIILACCLFQVFAVKKALHLSWYQGAVTWLIGLIPTYIAFRLAMPSDILYGGARALVTKANGQMRAVSVVMVEHHDANGALPIPVDEGGMAIEPVASQKMSESSPTQEVPLYYRGPSYVPDTLAERVYEDRKPNDPFRVKDLGPYGYGAGPIQGASAAFILTSRGPDMESQSEELEYLYLDKLRGDADMFKIDPECLNILYSPTNGTVSPGDLCRGHR
jgi:hypothetical protein